MVDNVTPILMPQAGNTMEEGTILKWRVNVGDTITYGQVLCDIESDKATIELESVAAGRLAKIVPEGTVVPVKNPIAYLAENDADLANYLRAESDIKSEITTSYDPASPAENSPTPASTTPSITPSTSRLKASPAARKLAADQSLDLARIHTGSGPSGRILSTDVEQSQVIANKGLTGVRKPLSKMRKAIALNLQTSKQTIPHFYVKLTIDADPLLAFYRAQKPATGCTLNDVILLSVGQVLTDMPAFRSHIEGHDIVEMPSANIGLAVSVPDGLVVPVILNVQTLTLKQLALETKRIVQSARNGKIENLGQAVFTITNMGMLGVEDFSAIINPPESGILAISAVREAVLVHNGVIRAGRIMSMTLSVDHRVVDGALAAEFVKRLKELLEKPEILLK